MDATRDRLLADPGLPKRTRKQLVAAVTARLADRNADVREAAVAAVGALGLDPELARPLLTDPGARIRLRAAGILVR